MYKHMEMAPFPPFTATGIICALNEIKASLQIPLIPSQEPQEGPRSTQGQGHRGGTTFSSPNRESWALPGHEELTESTESTEFSASASATCPWKGMTGECERIEKLGLSPELG